MREYSGNLPRLHHLEEMRGKLRGKAVADTCTISKRILTFVDVRSIFITRENRGDCDKIDIMRSIDATDFSSGVRSSVGLRLARIRCLVCAGEL